MRVESETTVLLVDDDGHFRAAIAEALERARFRVVQAASGADALEFASRASASVVLLGVELPGVSGYEVCHQLREMFGDALWIVFVAAERARPLDRVAGLLIGADDYLVKPVEPDEVVARVRRLAARSRSVERGRRPYDLTRREGEVLTLLASGMGQRAIARELVISSKTVATHIQRILTKLDAHSRAEAVARAHRERLV